MQRRDLCRRFQLKIPRLELENAEVSGRSATFLSVPDEKHLRRWVVIRSMVALSTASAPGMLTAAPASTKACARERRAPVDLMSCACEDAVVGQSSSRFTSEISGAKMPRLSMMPVSF